MTAQALPIDWSRYTLLREIVAREVKDLRPYPFNSVWIPSLSDEDYALLLESIRANGVTEPLTVTPDSRIIDGQARWRVAAQIGLHTLPVRVLEAPGEPDYALWAVAVNLARRHLSTVQRFSLLQAALAILETRARAQRQTTQFRPKAKSPTESTLSAQHSKGSPVLAHLPKPSTSPIHTHVEAARLVGVSPRQAGKMIAIVKHAPPELQEAIATNQTSVHQAYKAIQAQRGKHRSRGGKTERIERIQAHFAALFAFARRAEGDEAQRIATLLREQARKQIELADTLEAHAAGAPTRLADGIR